MTASKFCTQKYFLNESNLSKNDVHIFNECAITVKSLNIVEKKLAITDYTNWVQFTRDVTKFWGNKDINGTDRVKYFISIQPHFHYNQFYLKWSGLYFLLHVFKK